MTFQIKLYGIVVITATLLCMYIKYFLTFYIQKFVCIHLRRFTLVFNRKSLTKIVNLIFPDVIVPITATGISCYKCLASQSGYDETDLLCSHFNESAEFQVYCPSSTLCRKKTIYSKFQCKFVFISLRIMD